MTTALPPRAPRRRPARVPFTLKVRYALPPWAFRLARLAAAGKIPAG